jgi:hypothetical protein
MMRVICRVAGIFFLIVGLGLLVMTSVFALHRESVLYSGQNWKAVAGLAVMASVFLLAGGYLLRTDPEAPDRDQPGAFTLFLIANGRQVQLLASLGSLISTARFGAACFGTDWPGRWVEWPLVLGLGVLLHGSRDITKRDWTTLRRWPRQVKKLEGAIVMICLALFAGIQWYPMLSYRNALQPLPDGATSRGMTRIVFAGGMAILYALEALFRSHQDLEPDARRTSATKANGGTEEC